MFSDFVDIVTDCEILSAQARLAFDESPALAKRWPVGVAQPKTFRVGQVRVAVAVNKKNGSVSQVTFSQIRDMLRVDGRGKQWQELGGGAGEIHPYGEREFSTSRLVIRQACMIVGDEQPGWHYTFRPEFEMLDAAEVVIEKLRTDRHGIGFFLYTGQELPPHVKLLDVARTADDKPITLETGRVIQDDYPLAEHLVLYLRPDASRAARAFCEFAVSPAGAEIAAKHGLTTPAQDAESAGEKRLADAKAGRGQKIFVSGSPTLRTAMPDLAVEYVRAREVIQVTYAATDSEAGIVGGFVSDRPNRPELVFLSGPPQGKALEMHGERWNVLKPESHLLAGRATALVVNAANKIDALTLDQIEAIWSGAADDWSVIEGTGLTPPDRPLPGSKGPDAIPVHRFGLRKNDPAAEVFERARPPRAKQGRLTFLPNTKEVVAVVGIDPYAIGFVDLAAIPKTGQTVKVLGIVSTEKDAGGNNGPNPKIVRPTAASVRDGSYPFAEWVFVYVHPEASDAAKGFAKFLAVGEALDQAYEKHGLLALVRDKIDLAPSPSNTAPSPAGDWSFP